MAPPQIDHVVVLVPYAELLTPPRWVTDNFTLTPGGAHPSGATESNLIVFEDGTYLELLAFVNDSPSLRLGHPWGDKKFGFVDFALTTPPEFDYDALRARVSRGSGGLGIEYGPPREEGWDCAGKEVRWRVAAPRDVAGGEAQIGRRGEVPFWCDDITARAARVEVGALGTTHPSGVRGIAQFTILVPDGKTDAYADLYSAVMDTGPVRMFGTTRLLLETPVHVPGLVKPWVFIEPPTLDVEKRKLRERGPGIVEIALRLGVEGEVGLGRASIDEMGVWIHFLR